MKLKIPVRRLIGAALFVFGFSPLAQADYPEQPVTIVVPYAPGGATDSSARIMAHSLSELTGKPFIVENVPGAGTTIGFNKVAKAKPDGYTLLFGGLSANVLAPHIYQKIASSSPDAFEPIGMVATQPLILVVNENSAYQSLQDLLNEATKRPEALNFGSPGQGSAPHLISELFLVESGVQATHIPFKGAAPALVALLAGHLDFFLDTPTAPMPHVEGGKLRALGMTSLTAPDRLQQIPTLNEQGIEGFEAATWFALFAPKGTDEEKLETLNQWVNEAMASPAVQEQMVAAYLYAVPSTREELKNYVEAERERWTAIIDVKGLQQE